MGIAEILLIASLLLLGVAVYLFVSFFLGEEDQQAALSWASGEEPEKSKSSFIEFSRPLAHRFALNLAKRWKLQTYRKRIHALIKVAGLSRELNVDEFIAIQMLWGILFPIFFSLVNFSLQLGFSPLVIVFMGVLGVYLPVQYCRSERNQRKEAVLLDLPFFIDLLALATKAGMDFVGAIQKLVEKAEDSVLANEFAIVLQDTKLGRSRKEALRDMAERLDMSEITSFVAVLLDADATGTSIASVLQQQSEQMRMERFARAEKAGARASQLMLLPMMIFILPAVFIMVFGPIILQFMGQG
tara:strand:- start:13093 stop:13992 length:900 start_codon:yes stop_codon:yes gene_type:complete